eukprot:2059702-Prymnesium_polylepis.1
MPISHCGCTFVRTRAQARLVESDTELRSGCTSRMRERVSSVRESRRSIKQCQACKKAGGPGGFRHDGKGFRHAGSKWNGCDSGMTER